VAGFFDSDNGHIRYYGGAIKILQKMHWKAREIKHYMRHIKFTPSRIKPKLRLERSRAYRLYISLEPREEFFLMRDLS
jgi:hypothetical protein